MYANDSNENIINTRIIGEWKTSDSALEYEKKKKPCDIDNGIVVIVLRICRDKKNIGLRLLLYRNEFKADYNNIVVN